MNKHVCEQCLDTRLIMYKSSIDSSIHYMTCQECCPHSDVEHFTCMDCDKELDISDAVSSAHDYEQED